MAINILFVLLLKVWYNIKLKPQLIFGMEKEVHKAKLFVPFCFSVYYLITGLWPIIDINSFMFITGPKTDIWLVKTVGALISLIGGIILLSAIRKKMVKELVLLAIGACIVLSFIDIYYVYNDIISPIYLIDAIGEFAFIILWILYLLNNRLS
jgi:hypothetical protein